MGQKGEPRKLLLNILSFFIHSLKIIQINFVAKQIAECVIELFREVLGSPKYSFQNTKRENHANFS